MKKRIHVDQHAIRRNREKAKRREEQRPPSEIEDDVLFDWLAETEPEPPISVKTYKGNVKCFEVEIKGPSKMVYSPDKPLSCGARLWIETDAEVVTR